MKVYLLSSRFNKDINLEITNLLESNGHEVHLPARDTPQTGDGMMYEGNIGGIKSSDIVLAVIKGSITRNWAYEFAYAQALNKNIICAILGDNDLKEHGMVNLGVGKVKVINSVEELEEVLK